MNLNDLRTHLNSQADDLDTSTDSPVPALKARATKLRRRRRVAAGLTAAAAVAAVISIAASVLPDNSTPDPIERPSTVQPSVGPDGLPVRVPPPDSRDIAKDGYRFRYQPGGETLLAGEIGDPGKSDLKLTVKPKSNRLTIRFFCNTSEERPGGWRISIVVNGQFRLTEDRCPPKGSDPALDGFSYNLQPLPEEKWVGKDLRVRLLIADSANQPILVPDMRVGLGVYDSGKYRDISTDVSAPEIIEHQGAKYRLDQIVSLDDSGDGAFSERTGPLNTPFIALYGATGNASAQFDPDGGLSGPPDSTEVEGPGISYRPIPARPDGTVWVFQPAKRGIQPTGKLILGFYTPVR
ncbi:hypothetical protein [Kribbella deserti]|uniref:Uncharacterized protein n=1 Tax=Kribbella deserti TaxID=1926257 RepID=A0ABV6QVG0_9ACTN